MRIYFSNLSVFNKNAKRIQFLFENLQINDRAFDEKRHQIKLTSIKNSLASAYGYNGMKELAASLSEQEPQLKDLTNDEMIQIEDATSRLFAEYLASVGVSQRISQCIAMGIDIYLRHQAENAKNRLKYNTQYRSYTELSKMYGVTVNAMNYLQLKQGGFPVKPETQV